LPEEDGMKDSRLREFEELVLLSVLIATPDAYGTSLQEILEEEAGRKASLGAIYTALDRLARKGLVLSELGDPTPVRGGRRKRHYELTPEGLEKVRETRRIRERMWERVTPDILGEEGAR
jgi:DNA-binding PadR family transcriptional regulator